MGTERGSHRCRGTPPRGITVVRTSLPDEAISPEQAVFAYKSLARIEHALRNLMLSRLEVRPIYVHNADHVRAHVFLCMLTYHLEWHLRQRLAPILFQDHDPEGAEAKRTSPVQEANVSDSTRKKAASKTTPDGLPVHSMQSLLADLASLTWNEETCLASPTIPSRSSPSRRPWRPTRSGGCRSIPAG